MIYIVISILLVSAGIFLFLFSLFYTGDKTVSKIRKAIPAHDPAVKPEAAEGGKTNVKTVTALFRDSDDTGALNHNEIDITSLNENGEPALKDNVKLKAVLFEDSTGAVDYSKFSIPLDLDADYSGFKRIGPGDFSVDAGGINFISDKKLYRFDFHRIREIKTGSNYLVMIPSSDTAAKLFIFDKEYPELKKTEEQFSLSRKG